MPFTVATYNVLANAYINPAWYRRTPAMLLNPAWRVPALIEHVSTLKADILCVQELEPDVFASLRTVLAANGYHAQYARKGAARPDGVATFYKKDRYELLTADRLVYADGAGGPESGYVALFLTCRSRTDLIGIINTHLIWDPPGGSLDSRRGYREVNQLLDSWRKIASSARAWVLAGDFNAPPESDLVKMIRRAGFNYSHCGAAQAPTCNINNEPRMIDYLFHTAALRSQPHAIRRIDGATVLPSAEEPSDHVPVAADFDWAAGA